MTTFYVLRHGEILNPNNVVYLRMDEEIGLSPLGEQQVASQAQRLKDKQIMAIYHSPLWRTKRSGEIVEGVVRTGHLVADPRLIDCYSPIQGMDMDEYDRRYAGNLYHPKLIAQGGETMKQVKNRMMGLIEELAAKNLNQAVVVVSHGDPIKILWLVADRLELTKENLGGNRHPLPGVPYPAKGSVTVLEYKEGKLKRKDYWAT